MRLPEHAPPLETSFANLTPTRIEALMRHANPLPTGKYLHWDELRRRSAPEGLTHAEWWTAVTFGRMPLFQQLPLLDKQGQPFVFTTPAPVAIDLHHLDRDRQVLAAAGGHREELSAARHPLVQFVTHHDVVGAGQLGVELGAAPVRGLGHGQVGPGAALQHLQRRDVEGLAGGDHP